ncbi:MAG: formate/nitrite transporter family protein [Coriobacteriales bacterium]|jgi:formate transporter
MEALQIEVKAVTPEDVREVSGVALSGYSTEQKAGDVGKGKANPPVARQIPLAMLAGMFIACGALFMEVVKADSTLSFAVSQILGGLCFSLGLICVVVAGAELFTGNSLMVIGAMEKKFSWGSLFKNWVVVWIFNFIGSLIIVFVVFFSGIGSMNDGGVAQAMMNVAVSKVNLSWSAIFFRGIICNFLVCLAVWMGFCGKSVIDKIFTCIFPVMAFVAVGAEHCVANMFFLPMGLLMKDFGGIISTNANIDLLNIGSVFFNISAATVGNIVGGAIFVGMFYWWAYHKKAAKKAEAPIETSIEVSE